MSSGFWFPFEGPALAVGFLADPVGVTRNVEDRRGGVMDITRWRGTERLAFGAADALFDESGVEGESRALGGFGVGVSGDFNRAVLFGTGADTRREAIEGLGRLETLLFGWTKREGGFKQSGGTGVAFGERVDTICGCFDGARILLAMGPLIDLTGALMDAVGSSGCLLVAIVAVGTTRGNVTVAKLE